MILKDFVIYIDNFTESEEEKERKINNEIITLEQLCQLIELEGGTVVHRITNRSTHYLKISADTNVRTSRSYQKALDKGLAIIDLKFLYNTLIKNED